jgi:hypothetical protein
MPDMAENRSTGQPAVPVGQDERDGKQNARGTLVEIDKLEILLIEAARDGRSLTYADVLAHFGIRITPRRVYALCRDLGEVCARNRARREPELAVLVVRKAVRLPGEGFFHALWRDGLFAGPATGPRAQAFIREETARVFGFWRTTSSKVAP